MRNQFPEAERRTILNLSQQELFRDDGKEALEYLMATRGFDEKTIRKFSLGYVPKDVKAPNGERHELAGRLIFPIKDSYGELVAFSSRMPNVPKSFWHETFNKKIYLYGLDVAKNDVIKSKKAILVEGEFDVMKLHQFGVGCAVGVMGSAPQFHQIALLRRYCKEIFLCFDSDKAGIAAANKIIENDMSSFLGPVFLDTELIKVQLPEKKDPDEFIKEFGPKELINLLRKSKEIYYKREELNA